MLLKFVIFALVAYALYRMFMNDRNKKTEDSREEKEKRVATGDMSKDPICGAYVENSGSISVRNGDQLVHFCSYDCREKYLKQLEEKDKLEK
jgi:YHS domain-containing protein